MTGWRSLAAAVLAALSTGSAVVANAPAEHTGTEVSQQDLDGIRGNKVEKQIDNGLQDGINMVATGALREAQKGKP